MKFLSALTIAALSLSGVNAVPSQIGYADEVASLQARTPDFQDASVAEVARSVDEIEKRQIEVVKRPNGPAPPSTGDPHGPPKRSLGLVKRPNGPAPPSKGDPHGPPKRSVTEDAVDEE